jgi:hypothetical protein
MSFWTKISLWVLKIRGFKGGIGVPKPRGSLDSTGAGLLNHQTSKISINSIYMKISLWVFKVRGFEGGIRVPKHGVLHISPGWNCEITKHLKIV